MIGLARGSVQVVPYQPDWPDLFEQEAKRLRAELGPAIAPLEHVGSTAIPGMCAKPIIDMLGAVAGLAAAHGLIPALERLGYEQRSDDPVSGRLFFVLGPETGRTHHLSMTTADSSFWREHLAFRDHLRTHPVDAEAYALLKQQLAIQFPHDRCAYTSGKNEFIMGILGMALPGGR